MFKRQVQSISDLLQQVLRNEGLEMPLQQKRLVDSWETVAGPVIAKYTKNKFIKNQTLFIQLVNPALRQDLSMQKTDLMNRLNAVVGAKVIYDIKFY